MGPLSRCLTAAGLLAVCAPAQGSDRPLPDANFADAWNLPELASRDFKAMRGSTLLIEIWRTW